MASPPPKNSVQRPLRQAPPTSSASGGTPLSSTLGSIAIAIGVGVVGAYMLDLHGHTCEGCGRRWRHFGAFNLGDAESHTCSRCGEVQWWKCGAPHVLGGPELSASPRGALGAGTEEDATAALGTSAVPAGLPSPSYGGVFPSPQPSGVPQLAPQPSGIPQLALPARKVPR